MSLFKTIGNIVKGVIPGPIDDVIIDVLTGSGTEDESIISKIGRGFFPGKEDASPFSSQPFFALRKAMQEQRGSGSKPFQRYTGQTQARYTRFMTEPIAARFRSEIIQPEKSKQVTPVRTTRAAKTRIATS